MAKVYKRVTVTLTKELIIGVDEDQLTPESLEHFSKYFWKAEDANEIFETCGDQYVRCSESFIEGVGAVSSYRMEGPVSVKEIYEDTEVEIEDYVKE